MKGEFTMRSLTVWTCMIALLVGGSTVFGEILTDQDCDYDYGEDGIGAILDLDYTSCEIECWAEDPHVSSWLWAGGYRSLYTTQGMWCDWSYSINLLGSCDVQRIHSITPYAYSNVFGHAVSPHVNDPQYSWALIDEDYWSTQWGPVGWTGNGVYVTDSNNNYFGENEGICVEYDAITQAAITQDSEDYAYAWAYANLSVTLE